MIIIELTYKKSLDEVNSLLQEHRDFLEKYYLNKMFLFSGPKKPRTGGIIFAAGSLSVINKVIEEDPFYQHGIADYRVIEFEPSNYSVDFENIFATKSTN